MSDPVFYSDRVHGQAEPVHDQLPEATSRGLLSLIAVRMNQEWFALSFPDWCPDRKVIAGTDFASLRANMQALVPGAPWPVDDPDVSAPDDVVFDLVEYAARRIAQPEEAYWHEWFGHPHLDLDSDAGSEMLRREVNQMLQRGQAMYTLTDAGEVHRTGTPELQEVQRTLVPDTGDPRLDELINDARVRYRSHRAEDRRVGLERLWDAYERLKTVDALDKPTSTSILLAGLSSPWRATVEAEMRVLNDIGNSYQIRHFETRTHPLPDSAAVEYLFVRLGALLTHLLSATGRLGVASTAPTVNVR